MTGRKLPEYNLYFSNPVGLAGIVFGFKGHPSQSMIEGNSGAHCTLVNPLIAPWIQRWGFTFRCMRNS